MKHIKRAFSLLLALIMAASMALPCLAADSSSDVTVLFVHDLHSHLLPANDENGNSYGGYARLKTAIEREKQAHPDALIVDAGDFSMGSLFQTSFRSSAVELRIMGSLGIQVTTFGNHEYDYGPEGLNDMLTAAMASGDPLPKIVETNFLPLDESVSYVADTFSEYGIEPYILMEQGGVWFAVFSAFGDDSERCSPTSGMERLDIYETSSKTISEATERCLRENGTEPVVICLSHTGTEDGKGEDYSLAEKVKGIDIIVSAHTHTTLSEPIKVGDTYIVSAGEYSKYLGSVTLSIASDGSKTLKDYTLIPIDSSVPEDASLSEYIEGCKGEVENDYLSIFGMGFDEVLAYNPYTFDSVDDVYAELHESTLCNLFSDAYKWAVEQTTGEKVDVALTASGVIRESFAVGDVTVSDVFTAASLGNGKTDVPGGALISIWLTGKDLRDAIEVDASVYPLMHAAQLFFSGPVYEINNNRMIFNRTASAGIMQSDGTVVPIDDDQLYRVVTGTYAGNMLGSVKTKSFGLLSITPRDENGNPIPEDSLADYIVTQPDGSELKEWYAIATYLQEMGGEIDEAYSAPDGRKIVYSSLSPVKMLQNANKFTYIALALIVVIILAVVLIIKGIKKKRAKRKAK